MLEAGRFCPATVLTPDPGSENVLNFVRVLDLKSGRGVDTLVLDAHPRISCCPISAPPWAVGGLMSFAFIAPTPPVQIFKP